MKPDPTYERVLRFAKELNTRNAAYTMAVCRPEAVMFRVSVPGERWEIEFMDDGAVEIERFVSDGNISGEAGLADLWTFFD